MLVAALAAVVVGLLGRRRRDDPDAADGDVNAESHGAGMNAWVTVLVACALAYVLELAGYLVPAHWLSGPRISRVTALLPVALLTGLVVVQTFATPDHGLTLDARAAGLGVAVVALLLRAPFIVVVVLAAGTAALLRTSAGADRLRSEDGTASQPRNAGSRGPRRRAGVLRTTGLASDRTDGGRRLLPGRRDGRRPVGTRRAGCRHGGRGLRWMGRSHPCAEPRSPEAVDACSRRRGRGRTVRCPVRRPSGRERRGLSDPDGHRSEVAHNPFWTVTDDGRTLVEGS